MEPSHLTISSKLVSSEHFEPRFVVLTFGEDVNAKSRRNLRTTYLEKGDERNRGSQKKYLVEAEATTLQTMAVGSLALAPALQVELG